VRRREFIALIAGAAVLPHVAQAQQPPVPVIGFLRSASLADVAYLVTAFQQGLKEAGFVDGQNVAIEYRSAEDHLERLPALVADLIGRQAAVIVGNHNAALAAKAAATVVPIVFVTGADPVRDDRITAIFTAALRKSLFAARQTKRNRSNYGSR
jgi:putative ABC transport system substrate-binding protein